MSVDKKKTRLILWMMVIAPAAFGVAYYQSRSDRTEVDANPQAVTSQPSEPMAPANELSSEKAPPALNEGVDAPTGPVAEASSAESLVARAPIVETSSAASPAHESPVHESPVHESPVHESPVIESPVDNAAAIQETPVNEAPVAQARIAEAQVAEAQVVAAPRTEIPPTEVTMTDVPTSVAPRTEAVAKPANFWLWLGAGMNFQRSKQSVPSVEGNLAFENILGPTTTFRGGFQGERFGFDAIFTNTPGTMESSPTTQVTNGDFNWRTISMEGLYRVGPEWNVRFGIQHHLLPFMVLDANTATIDVKANSLSLATLGFDYHFPLTRELRAEWMMRYQLPFSSGSNDGSSFVVNPELAFDGSVGGVYALNRNVRLGMHWYGQYHQYQFEHGSGASRVTGQQSFILSTAEVRVGIEF